MKTKGQQHLVEKPGTAGLFVVGVAGLPQGELLGHRRRIRLPLPPLDQFAQPVAGNCELGFASGLRPKAGLTPAVILARFPEESKAEMTCHNCQTECRRFGRNKAGHQRFRCRQCSRTFTELGPRSLGDMRLPLDRALLCLQLLLEGNSVRSTERITGVHRDTILALLEVAGERCEALLNSRICAIRVRDVECDEIWGWVGMEEKRKTIDTDLLGDAYCFVGMERNTKLILAWHIPAASILSILPLKPERRAATPK